MNQESAVEQDVRYEPDETPRPLVAWGLAVQHAALSLASMVVTVLIVVRSAGLARTRGGAGVGAGDRGR